MSDRTNIGSLPIDFDWYIYIGHLTNFKVQGKSQLSDYEEFEPDSRRISAYVSVYAALRRISAYVSVYAALRRISAYVSVYAAF